MADRYCLCEQYWYFMADRYCLREQYWYFVTDRYCLCEQYWICKVFGPAISCDGDEDADGITNKREDKKQTTNGKTRKYLIFWDQKYLIF